MNDTSVGTNNANDFALKDDYDSDVVITKVRELIFLNAHGKTTVTEVDNLAMEMYSKMTYLFYKYLKEEKNG